ncbi:MAG: hypothetical protein ACRDPY_45190 [Streptosporangiaceae bacterium]
MTDDEAVAGEAVAGEAVADAGALDFLLADAALGVLRRFRPDGSLLRLAAGLARRPRLVGGQAAPGTYVHDR